MLRGRLRRDGDASAGPYARPARKRAHQGRDQLGPSSPDETDSMVDTFLRLPDAIVLVDDAGIIVWGNRAAERIFERSLRDWVGESGLDLVHPDDHEFVLRSLT